MILYAQGEQWLAFSDAGARRIEPCPTLAVPAAVVWQPLRGAVGAAAFEGDPRHAGALIERRLRTEGAIEADTKVFVHHIERIGTGYQALYSTASLDEWQRLQHWCGRQVRHCAWMTLTALAWSMVQARTAVVLQTENTLQFFGRGDGRIVQAQAVAFGSDGDSLAHAARTLGDRMRDDLRQIDSDASARLSVRWVSVFAQGDAVACERLMEAFRDASGLRVTSDDVDIVFEDAPARSALPLAAARPPLRLLLNTPRDRLALAADRHRLAVAATALALSAGFLAVAGHKLFTARRLAADTQATLARTEETRRNFAPTPPSDDRAYREQIGFVETLIRLQGGFDVADVLLALKTASGPGLRILSVRSEERPEKKPPTTGAALPAGIVVDGVLPDDATVSDSLALSSFVRSLAGSGYMAEPLDTRAAAAASSVSSRLFTYRLTPTAATAATPAPPQARESRP